MNIQPDSVVAALATPYTIEEFFSRYWPDNYVATHGPLSRLPRFFQAPELANFQALASKYRGCVSFGSGSRGSRTIVIEQVKPDTLFSMGLSVYLSDITPCVPGASAFLKQLERELGINEGARALAPSPRLKTMVFPATSMPKKFFPCSCKGPNAFM